MAAQLQRNEYVACLQLVLITVWAVSIALLQLWGNSPPQDQSSNYNAHAAITTSDNHCVTRACVCVCVCVCVSDGVSFGSRGQRIITAPSVSGHLSLRGLVFIYKVIGALNSRLTGLQLPQSHTAYINTARPHTVCCGIDSKTLKQTERAAGVIKQKNLQEPFCTESAAISRDNMKPPEWDFPLWPSLHSTLTTAIGVWFSFEKRRKIWKLSVYIYLTHLGDGW